MYIDYCHANVTDVLLAMELSASGDTMNSSIQSNGGDDTKSAADGKRKVECCTY